MYGVISECLLLGELTDISGQTLVVKCKPCCYSSCNFLWLSFAKQFTAVCNYTVNNFNFLYHIGA